MSEQDGNQASILQSPTGNNNQGAWKAYWKSQGQIWRTEPEINNKRQEYLANRQLIPPNGEQGIYPFKDIRLSRADVEWLLATHLKGHESVNCSDESQWKREGLDMRGANLQRIDLSHMPLSHLGSRYSNFDWLVPTKIDFDFVIGPPLKGVCVFVVQLEGANLREAQLKGTNLCGAQLKGANLIMAQIKRACLRGAQLERATLSYARLERANLFGAQLEGADLFLAQLKGADLSHAQLERATLSYARLKGADLSRAQLKRANLSYAQLKGADLREAQLKGTNLCGAQLKGADLIGAQLEGADLSGAQLEEAKLQDIILGNKKHVSPLLADVQWGNTNLAVVNWSQVRQLGDENVARQKKTSNGKAKDRKKHLAEYRVAVRANRQLAVVLRDQGLNEEADRFAYHAQVLQNYVLWYQVTQQELTFGQRTQALGGWLFSCFLFLLAGYGYKPGRSLVAYLVIIFGFMGLYLLNAHIMAPHLTWDEALVLSVSSFHGRGFFTQNVTLGDTYARLAAIEAIVGLFIEISFIATFTQRFFGK